MNPCNAISLLHAGDGNDNKDGATSFPIIVTRYLKYFWKVELWSWKNQLNNAYRKLQRQFQDRLTIKYFDDHLLEGRNRRQPHGGDNGNRRKSPSRSPAPRPKVNGGRNNHSPSPAPFSDQKLSMCAEWADKQSCRFGDGCLLLHDSNPKVRSVNVSPQTLAAPVPPRDKKVQPADPRPPSSNAVEVNNLRSVAYAEDDELYDLEDEDANCVICVKAIAVMALMPCGCICVCHQCSSRIEPSGTHR